MMKEIKTEFFILDLESRPQESLIPLCEDELKPSGILKDPVKIAADIESKKLGLKKKMSVDPDFADIVCIGIKQLGEDGYLLSPKEFVDFCKVHPYAVFITYNGKSFDIPLLIKHGLKNGLDLPYQRLKGMCQKYKENGHIDLMEIICDREYKSLDLILQIYLGIKKTPIDFNTATDEEIGIHCLEDLKNTELLYNQWKNVI